MKISIERQCCQQEALAPVNIIIKRAIYAFFALFCARSLCFSKNKLKKLNKLEQKRTKASKASRAKMGY